MTAEPMETRTPLLVLDIDGTVREGKEDALGRFVNGPDDVVVFPEAAERMKLWRDLGGRIIGVSNQGGIALGIVSEAAVQAAMEETQRQLVGLGARFDRILWCHHHPDAADGEMSRCWCRKPSPGLVVEGALGLAEQVRNEIYPPHLGLFVGDRPEDRECARLSGFDFVAAAEWRMGAWS